MVIYEDSNGHKWLNFYWEDLTEEAQKAVIEALGHNGCFDIYPIGTIPYANETVIDFYRFTQ